MSFQRKTTLINIPPKAARERQVSPEEGFPGERKIASVSVLPEAQKPTLVTTPELECEDVPCEVEQVSPRKNKPKLHWPVAKNVERDPAPNLIPGIKVTQKVVAKVVPLDGGSAAGDESDVPPPINFDTLPTKKLATPWIFFGQPYPETEPNLIRPSMSPPSMPETHRRRDQDFSSDDYHNSRARGGTCAGNPNQEVGILF